MAKTLKQFIRELQDLQNHTAGDAIVETADGLEVFAVAISVGVVVITDVDPVTDTEC